MVYGVVFVTALVLFIGLKVSNSKELTDFVVGIFVVVALAMLVLRLVYPNLSQGWQNGLEVFFHFYDALIIFLGLSILLIFVANMMVGKQGAPIDGDYILIHGTYIRPDESLGDELRKRVDKALAIYRQGDNMKFIVSGGQGHDEPVSEAVAMRAYLVDAGVDADRIIMEDQSKTTYENLLYSKALVREANPQYIFVSSDYHMFRIQMMAKKLGMRGVAVGSEISMNTKLGASVREYFALVISEWHMALFLFLLCFGIASFQ